MKCIICGSGSGIELFCSHSCSSGLYNKRKEPKSKYLLSNLKQLRNNIQKLFDKKLYASANRFCALEEIIQYEYLEPLIGFNKLAEILRKDFDETQKVKEETRLCCL